MITPDQRAAIRERVETTNARNTHMNSGCGEYHCNCHNEILGLLDDLDEAAGEIESLRFDVEAMRRITAESRRD